MIHYPNGKKHTTVEKEKTYANRGLAFEEEINASNDYYRLQNRAIIYKKPTPIKVVKMVNKSQGHCIEEAYFQAPSTTDYNGVYRGKYLDFEAKETRNKTSFPLSNLHPHQWEHLKQIRSHGGIGFLLVYFRLLNQIFLLDIQHILPIIESGKASVPLVIFQTKGYEVKQGYVIPFDYLKVVDEVYFIKE